MRCNISKNGAELHHPKNILRQSVKPLVEAGFTSCRRVAIEAGAGQAELRRAGKRLAAAGCRLISGPPIQRPVYRPRLQAAREGRCDIGAE